MNGGGGSGSEADDMLKTISQSQQVPQQQQMVDSTMPVSSFPQHLGQLTTSNVDQLVCSVVPFTALVYILY